MIELPRVNDISVVGGSGDRTTREKDWMNQCTLLGLLYSALPCFVAFSLAMVCLYVFARHPFMSIVISVYV